jgi:hypothetical protein
MLQNPGKLIVKPMNAKLSHDTEWLAKMDPYIVVEIGS